MRSFADRISFTASFWPAVSGPLLRCPCTCQPRIGARPRAWPAPHQGHGLALLADRAVGRERVLGAGQVDGVQRSRPSPAPRLRAPPLPIVDRARRMGERGGEQVGAGEHRLALGEMRHRPGDSVGRGRRRRRRSFRSGFPCRRPVPCPRTGADRSAAGASMAGAPPCRAASARTSSRAPSWRRRSRDSRAGPVAGSAAASRHRQRTVPAPATSAPGIEAEIGRLRFATRRAARRGRCRASRPASSAPRAPPGADCRPRRRDPRSFHRRLDLGAAGRERLDRRARHARDLEAPVGMGLLDAVAELRRDPPASSLR